MTRDKRVKFLKGEFANQLRLLKPDDPLYKILWLVRHLEQYIERWMGFAELDQITIESTLHNEVYYVVVAAVQTISIQVAELQPSISFPREEWKYFCNALKWIQQTPEKTELELINKTFRDFNRKIPNGNIEIDMTSF